MLRLFAYFFCSVIDIPDRQMQVGSTVSYSSPSIGFVKPGAEDMDKTKSGRRDTKFNQDITLHTPPNMSVLLCRDSYDDYVHRRSPVKPISHCWCAQENVYIGCEHGQLLLVYFETGIVKTLTNPEVI